jgi:hypothetical protein
VATPTSSYLQTLSKDEANEFLASLQKIKAHLSGELEWMKQQVEQKTLQLQGIEALLTEAIALGLSDATSDVTSTSETTDLAATSFNAVLPPASDMAGSDDELELPANGTSNGNGSAQSSPAAGTKPSSKSQAKTQSVTANKTNTTKKKPSSSKSSAKAAKSNTNRDLKELLLPTYAGKTLTDVVAQILNDTNKPLHLNDLLEEMYGEISDRDFKRAKISLANVLSVGKKEGKWLNLGEGLYTAK